MHGQNVKNRTAGTKRERNKQFMGNGWMEWAGKRMDKKDGQKGCKIDGNEGALMNKMREMEGVDN